MNEIAFQSKTEHVQTGYTDMLLCCCDLDLDPDPMTLIYEREVGDIPKIYCIPYMNILGQGSQK